MYICVLNLIIMDTKPTLPELSTEEITSEYKSSGETYRVLSDFVNKCGHGDSMALVELFSRDHRTLQQGIIRLALQLVERAGSPEYRVDPRNQWSANVCRQIMLGFDKELGRSQKGFLPSQFLGYI